MPTDEPADWATTCLQILQAGAEGPDRVFAVLVGAARRLTGSDGASVVGWQPTGPATLAHSGSPLPLPVRRIAEGLTTEGGRWVASLVVRGEIDLLTWWPGRPGAEHLEALRLLAALAAAASRQAGAALSSLYGVARQLLASTDREEMLLGLATATADVLRAEIAGVFLATPDGDAVVAEAVVGNRSIGTARLRLARGESLVGHVFATGEVYRSDDWTTDPVISKALAPLAAVEGTQAAIGAPMRVDGAVVGVLAAWRRRRSHYTDSDVELIGTLADLAALGVQRTLAEERLRELSHQLLAANDELSQRFEEARQALDIHQRLVRLVADGADLGSVVDTLRAITGQEVRFVGAEGTVIGTGGWLDGLLAAPRGDPGRRSGASGRRGKNSGERGGDTGEQGRDTGGRPGHPGGPGRDTGGRGGDVGGPGRKAGGPGRDTGGPGGNTGGPGRDTGGPGRGANGRDGPRRLGTEAVLLGPDGAGRHAISVTVRSAALRWGELAVATGLPVAIRDIVAIEQAAVACALLLSQRDAVAGAGRRLESEFVWDLLDGRISDGADSMVRVRQVGRELPAPARVILMSASGTRAGSPEGIDRLRTELARRTARLLADHGMHPPMGWRGETLAVLVPDRPADVVRRLGHELCALGPELDRVLTVGVSAPVHAITQYPVAGRQAGYARTATRPLDAPVAVFEDLGAVQFLLEPAHGEDLDRYADQELGVLLAYDRDHDADLVNTLRAYLLCDGHVQRAAESLTIHPKTMSYRLGRIEALTGIVVARQEDRFNAQLALKILDVRAGRPDVG